MLILSSEGENGGELITSIAGDEIRMNSRPQMVILLRERGWLAIHGLARIIRADALLARDEMQSIRHT